MIRNFVAEVIVRKLLVWLAGVLGTDIPAAAPTTQEWDYPPIPEHPIDPRNPYAEDRARENQD